MSKDNQDDRTQNTQLATGRTLSHILAAEAVRAIPPGKEENHYADFTTMIQWLSALGISFEIFGRQGYGSEMAQKIIEDGALLVDQIVNRMLGEGKIAVSTDNILNPVYDYLSEEDSPQESDLIFVFGAKTPLRMEKAIELYIDQLAPTILVSGGAPFYGSDHPLTEAERYKELALKKGISEDVVLTESEAITIPDNVRRGLNYLDEQHILVGSVIIVNSPYTQRRGWIHFMKYLNPNVVLYRVNSGTSDKFRRETWYLNEDGIRTLANEFVKMKVATVLNTA